MRKIRTCDFCNNHFIAFADLDLRLLMNQGGMDDVTYDIVFFVEECQAAISDCKSLLVWNEPGMHKTLARTRTYITQMVLTFAIANG